MSKKSEKKAEALRTIIDVWASRLNVTPKSVRIQRMTQKWGSCSTLGTVTLASDLHKKPRKFQEYVVAHELLHLRVNNHSKLFQATMTAHFPGWRKVDLER